MIKENIVSLVDGFTVELNPKVRHKLKSIPLDKKNNVYITYLPDATENDILETVDFVSKQELTPITHLPARTMKDLDHVSDFLKELRNRISSVASTQKITRAMQMVAASKLRKAQDAVESTRPYSDKLFQVVGNLSREMEGDDNAPKLLVGNGKSQRYLFVIATSERGLCGGFNSSITRLASQKARE